MAVDYLSAIGAGSGLNTTEIVNSLVEAERAPQQAILDRMVTKSEATISAYGVVKSTLASLKAAFDGLNDVSEVRQLSAVTSDSTAITAVSSSDATATSYNVSVTQLAERDLWSFDGFDATDESLNAGASITLSVLIDGQTTDVVIDSPTPQGIVDGLNAAGIGLSASIVDTGSSSGRYVITVSGDLGADAAFTITDPTATLTNGIQRSTAQDAELTVNGVAVSRSTNLVEEAIPGVALTLKSTGTNLIVDVNPNTEAVKQKIRDLVTTFNDVKMIFNSLQSREESDDELVGSLASDSTFRTIIRQIQNAMTSPISTASGNINYMSDLGVAFDREGMLQLDENRLDTVLTTQFDDVVTALTADTENQSEFGTSNRGLAGDVSVVIAGFTRTLGPVTQIMNNAQSRISEYEAKLEDLDARMERIQQRYLTQFTAMQQIVDEMNSTSEYLKNQFGALNGDN